MPIQGYRIAPDISSLGYRDTLYVFHFGYRITLYISSLGYRDTLYVFQFGCRITLYIYSLGYRVTLHVFQFGYRITLYISSLWERTTLRPATDIDTVRCRDNKTNGTKMTGDCDDNGWIATTIAQYSDENHCFLYCNTWWNLQKEFQTLIEISEWNYNTEQCCQCDFKLFSSEWCIFLILHRAVSLLP